VIIYYQEGQDLVTFNNGIHSSTVDGNFSQNESGTFNITADEVIRLETELDHLDRNLGNIALNIHVKTLEDQETALNIIRLSKALEEISDAAALIISPLKLETGIPHILRDVVQKTEEKISIHEVAEDSEAIGSTVIEFENQVHGMWIVAIYREERGYIIG